jgi:carnitine O-acetyltransferase
VRFDATGKVTLDHIYTQPDPRAYLSAMRELDYRIPELAKPYFAAVIEDCKRQVDVPKVLDIGSSYGINAALSRCDLTMDDLFDLYCDSDDVSRDDLLARDRELVRSRTSPARFIGLDIAQSALTYATRAGYLDDAVQADLEHHDLTTDQRRRLAGIDLVISTGCLGYVGVRTLSRVLAVSKRRPWMVHFVLRMFPFDEIAAGLAGHGYETALFGQVFKQRRFISREEQSQVLDTLLRVGVDPSGLETEGWLYAQLYVSRPRGGSGPALYEMSQPTKSRRQ